MRWGRIYVIPTKSTLAVPPTCLQGAWHARSLQSWYAAAASYASCVRRWHRARTLEARLSRSRLALNLHLPAAETVPATHVGGAPPCAARTCLLRSRRRRSAHSQLHTAVIAHCSTSTVYWCIASKLKAARNLYWMSNMFLWLKIFLFFVCCHVVPKRHSQLDYELNDL